MLVRLLKIAGILSPIIYTFWYFLGSRFENFGPVSVVLYLACIFATVVSILIYKKENAYTAYMLTTSFFCFFLNGLDIFSWLVWMWGGFAP